MPLPRVPSLCHACLPVFALAVGLACAMAELLAESAPETPGATQLEATAAKPFLPLEKKARIEAAFARVDRVMLCSLGLRKGKAEADPDKLDTPLVDIRGADKVLELVKALDLESGRFDQPCLCIGSHRLVFMRGDHYLFELSYHHLSRLRGEYGVPYWGDIQLSDKGAKAVIQWFKTNGFAGLEEEQLKQAAEITNRTVDHARLSALLPEKARAWLPAYDHNSDHWKWIKDEHVAALLGCFGHEQEGILTLWRMLGMDHKTPHGASPADFLLTALNHAKPAALLAATAALADDDVDAQLGAFLHAMRCYTDRDWEGDESVMRRILHKHLRVGLDAVSEYERHWFVRMLASAKAKPVPTLLASELERALAKQALKPERPPAAGIAEDRGYNRLLDLLAQALELRDPALHPALEKVQALPSLTDHERKICGVLSKLASETPTVDPEALLLQNVGYVDLSLLSWRAYRAGNPGEPSLRMLGAALNSPSYAVRDDARKLLRAAGVDLEESSTERMRQELGRRSEEPTAAARARLQDAAKAAKTEKSRKAAFDELGNFLLAQGEYEQALIAFRKAGAFGSIGATLAGVALERPNEGSHLSHGLTRSPEQADKFIAKGAAAFVVGRFDEAAKAFLAASMMADWPESENTAVAAELMGRLAGEPPAAPRGMGHQRSWVITEEEASVDAFARGAITKEEFIQRRGPRSEPATGVFTWWVVAQMARLNKDKTGEVEALRTGTALGAHASVWHVLMVNRARARELE